jgi:hypothetical protein
MATTNGATDVEAWIERQLLDAPPIQEWQRLRIVRLLINHG